MGPETTRSPETLERELRQLRARVDSLESCFEVCSLINASLDLDEVLDRIMATSRAVMGADACSLILIDEESQDLVFQIAQGSVGEQLKRSGRLKRGQGIAGYVFETGRPLLVHDAYKDPRFHRDTDEATGYRTRSVLCVPLKVKDRMIGVCEVINKRGNASFDDADQRTFTLLSAHAAIAIENARIHRALLEKQQIECDLAFARTVQQSFLPQEHIQVEGYRFHTHYQAALEVGGDFYDFIPLTENRLGILIGDVSGKGVSSALYMARLTSDFRFRAINKKGASRVVEKINDLLCERSQMGMFVTLCYLVLNISKRTIAFVNAGHVPPILWNHSQDRFLRLGQAAGPPLGILPGRGYHGGRIHLVPGDCLLLATDGVIEARDPDGRHFGWKRLEGAIRGGESQAESVSNRVMRALRAHMRGSPQSDDMTMVFLGVENTSCS